MGLRPTRPKAYGFPDPRATGAIRKRASRPPIRKAETIQAERTARVGGNSLSSDAKKTRLPIGTRLTVSRYWISQQDYRLRETAYAYAERASNGIVDVRNAFLLSHYGTRAVVNAPAACAQIGAK